LSNVLSEIDDKQDKKFEVNKELFLTQRDKVELIEKISDTKTSLMRTIYIVGLVQFLAIVGSLLAIINFMLR